jgi:hypothetical protein
MIERFTDVVLVLAFVAIAFSIIGMAILAISGLFELAMLVF